MKTIIITIFLSMVSFLGFTQTKGSEITLGQEVYDFGKVTVSNDTLVASFYFKNTGTEPLLISEVRPSCGCILSTYTSTILPGEGGVIQLKFYRNTEGPINKSATIYSNAITYPVKVIRIRGELIK
jgi:hypothetical protein